MLNIEIRFVSGLWSSCYAQVREFAVFPSPAELEQRCAVRPKMPDSELVLEPRAGTHERRQLCRELTLICNDTPDVINSAGHESSKRGEPRYQVMPFECSRAAARFYHVWPDTLALAMEAAARAQRGWERRSVDERCAVVEDAAQLVAGEHRQRIAAAAMLGQGMTAIQAEYNICQLVDYLRYGCVYLRELTKSRGVVDGGVEAHNRNQYHGLEGFWAAITPSDSLAQAAQLAITPAIMGNCVVWKPSDNAVLACSRVFDCLQCVGLPPGVINFVPSEKHSFLNTVCSNPNLAGISFSGTTSTLELIWQTIGNRIKQYARFPRIVGSGSGQSFHVVHSSAHLPNAVSCTARAAFEMAGQKSVSCSRVFVAQSVLPQFLDSMAAVTQSLVVCHPLDYRCFTSALLSNDSFQKVVSVMDRVAHDPCVQLVAGGRYDSSVGYYVEPTVYLVSEPAHELLVRAVPGPLLAVCPFPDGDGEGLEAALAKAPYALSGSIFAQEATWARWALGALRDAAAALSVNARCSEQPPAQLPVGGERKSGTGAKAGASSYLLHFCAERSLREALRPASAVTYGYMDETPRALWGSWGA